MAYTLFKEGFKLKDILALMGLAESTYHYHVNRFNKIDPDRELKELITEIFYEKKERMGYRGIKMELEGKKLKINHKKIQRLMKELGLKCIKFSRKTRRYNSYKGDVGKKAKNRLNRRFDTHIPLQKLVTDITEMKCKNDTKLYLSPILDLYNGEILSFSISKSPNVDFVMESLNSVIERVKKHAIYRTTVHSDQGFHYQNVRWVNTLKKNKIFQSMSRKGNCADNAAMESFFGIMKQEMYNSELLKSYDELKETIEEYIFEYNHSRRKKKLNGLAPVQYRKKHAYSNAA